MYAVRDPTPLVEGPGRLTSLGHDSFALRATAPGRFLVRVRYTRFLDAHARWRARGGSAPAAGRYVSANRPGRAARRALRRWRSARGARVLRAAIRTIRLQIVSAG